MPNAFPDIDKAPDLMYVFVGKEIAAICPLLYRDVQFWVPAGAHMFFDVAKDRQAQGESK